MDLLLTDRLTCPRCGPAFGLILRADRLEERRVLAGVLGCPNCRDHFPITDGLGDLRAPPRAPLELSAPSAPSAQESPSASDGDPDLALRLAAGMGIAEGSGATLLVGTPARFAAALAQRLAGVEVIALAPEVAGWAEQDGVSRLIAAPGLPFFDGALRGVALGGSDLGDRLLAEAVRVLAPSHRVAVIDPDPTTAERLRDAGLTEILEVAGLMVAGR